MTEYEPTTVDELEKGDEVKITYESNRSNTMQTKTGTVTSITRRGTGGFRFASIDTGEEYDDGTPKIVRINNHSEVRTLGKTRTTTIGYGPQVEKKVTESKTVADGSGTVLWEVDYTNPKGVRETATFQGSWVVEWFEREFPGEVHDVSTVTENSESEEAEELVTDGGTRG